MPDVRATVDEFYGGGMGTKWTHAEALQERCKDASTRSGEPSKVDLATDEPEDPVEDVVWNRDCQTTGTMVLLVDDTKLYLNEKARG